MTRKVLLIDDDEAVREALTQTLELNGFRAVTAGSFVAAKDHITTDFQGVILSDIRMPGRDGFHVLSYTHEMDAELPVILLTGEGDIPMAVRAMAEGAFGFLEKPCAAADMVAVLDRALRTRSLVLENRALKRQLESGDPAARMLFGISQQAVDLRARVRSVAPTGAEVLISGPPGSGISKVAEVLHLMSARAQGPFVKRAAADLSEEDLRSASKDASVGSLFLDEVALLPAPSQYVLLDMLEQDQGPRLLAGSTADLAEYVNNGRFSPDLYFRLDGMRVRVPALSERPEDIPVLFRHYVAQAAEQSGIDAPDIAPDHLAALMAQDWPGNARSLMSAAMRFVLGMPEEVTEAAEMGLAEQMARVERALLVAALGRHNGRASDAAKALKLPRKTLYDKLTKYAIRPDSFRR